MPPITGKPIETPAEKSASDRQLLFALYDNERASNTLIESQDDLGNSFDELRKVADSMLTEMEVLREQITRLTLAVEKLGEIHAADQ